MKNLINNFKYRLSFLFVLAVNALVFSQDWEDGGDPPPPEVTHGDGAPASPIDLYLIYLAIVAIFVIFYTYKKSFIIEKK